MYRDEYDTNRPTENLARALGWFSIALGVAELMAPRQLGRLIGAAPSDRTTTLFRSYGAREIASGIAILSRPDEARWVWSRVGGDAIDLASLGQAATDEQADRGRLSLAAAAVLGVAALDLLCARRLSVSAGDFDEFGFSRRNEQAVTIKAPLEEVEAAWVDWCASGGARLDTDYVIRFEPAPGARGTEVRLSGGGSKGTIREELRRFKQTVEAGVVAVSDGPGFWRPAQPARGAARTRTAAGVER